MTTPIVLADAVLVTTTQTGTGTYALGAAVDGYFHPSEASPSLNGSRVSYTVVDSLDAPTAREIGEGVLSSGMPWTLTRATIRRSKSGGTASGAAINWGAGTKYVYLTAIAAHTPQRRTDGRLNLGTDALSPIFYGGTAGGSANARTVTLSPAPAALADGMVARWVNGAAANTGAATFAPNGLTTKSILRPNGGALDEGDLPASTMIETVYSAPNDAWLLSYMPGVQQGVPVGTVAFVLGNSAPTGWLKLNGAAVSRTTYARLWAFAQASGLLAATEGGKGPGQFGPGNGSTTFTLPDARGEFIRGWDDGRGVDSGRAVGTHQADQMQRITGLLGNMWGTGAGSSGAFSVGTSASSNEPGTGGNTAHDITFDSNLSTDARTGTETRPRNVAWLACVKF